MEYMDTPGGKFQILINGEPAEFEAMAFCPYPYIDDYGYAFTVSDCYRISLSVQDLAVGDRIEVRLSNAILRDDRCVGRMYHAIGCVSGYAIGIGVTNTRYVQQTLRHVKLPYANAGFVQSGYALKIVREPGKYCRNPIQRSITVILVWESLIEEDAYDIVYHMTN